ncbi:MAG: putative DNA modification/repair radical SAM protein [Methylotenera sp.]|nr:putative DNA modification/repair radical SAM protein [Oligoflexia bacterium]
MQIREKLQILADAAKYDASCASSGSKRKNPGGLGNVEGMGICHSYTPDGRCVSLLKILLTNHCIYDCSYCINRVSSNVKRAKFTPEEIVWLTIEFYRRNYIEGLFLSSGIIRSPDETMEEMVTVARTLREVHQFGGYIHLKAVAGASKDLLLQAGQWADRLSANIELPSQTDLDLLAPAKKTAVIEKAMADIAEKIIENREESRQSPSAFLATPLPASPALSPSLAAIPVSLQLNPVNQATPKKLPPLAKKKQPPKFAPGGQSTQMIVGATPSSDSDILRTASGLYATHHLKRVYYSAFSPIPAGDSRLPLLAPPLIREHRLYQADWLMRFYGFSAEELTSKASPDLDLKNDPKLAWALRNRDYFPIDINQAARGALLRIPGFGVRNVDRILEIRKFHKVRMEDLVKLRLPLNRAKYFIITADAVQERKDFAKDHATSEAKLSLKVAQPEQLSLFDAALSARSGEL